VEIALGQLRHPREGVKQAVLGVACTVLRLFTTLAVFAVVFNWLLGKRRSDLSVPQRTRALTLRKGSNLQV
jgi:hypothetical protein